MKATLVSICRRKHRIQNSNLKSRSFRYGYLLLSLCLLFLVSVPVFAVDESGNVITSSFSFDCDTFSSFTTDWSVVSSGVTSLFSSNFYTKIFYDPFVSFNGIYIIDNDFSVSFPSSVNDFNYISFNVDVGVLSSNVLIENPTINIHYRAGNSNIISVPLDVTPITINYNGSDFSATNITFVADVSSLNFDPSFIDIIYLRYRLRTSGDFSSPFVMAPLTVDFYKHYQDVIADVNSNVQQIINQNDVIINNLNEVKGQLNNIHNSLSSDKNPDNPDLDSELSDANQIEQDFKDKFQDFVDIDKIDRVENIITDWTNNTKILSSFIFVRNVLDLLFDEVPILSILFSVGSACIILTMLFGIVSHSFRSPSGNVAQDPRSYMYNYIMFSNLSQQQTLSSKKADFHAFEKSDGSWGV